MAHISDLPPEVLLHLFHALHDISPSDRHARCIPDVCMRWHNLILGERFEITEEPDYQGGTRWVKDWVFSGDTEPFQWPWQRSGWDLTNYRMILSLTAEQASAMRFIMCERREAQRHDGKEFTDQELAECRCRWCKKGTR